MTTDEPISIATEDYFPALMDATRAGHEENGQASLDLQKIACSVWRGITRQRALFGVIGDPLLVKAFISLEIDPLYYANDDDMKIFEKILFVRKEFRKSDYSKRLIRFAKHVSDEMGLELQIGIISDKRLEAKERLYRRELDLAGVWFVHKPRQKQQMAVE